MKQILFCLSWFFGLSLVSAATAEKPNVVLFLADDMGWMDSGVYGSKYYETPNIDRFATRGVRFTRAYAQPLCSPTRASILSGKHTPRHGILTASGHRPPQPPGHQFMPETAAPNQPMLVPESKNYLDLSEVTLAEALHGAGYRTAHIGKWHLGLMAEHRPEKQGFDVAFHCAPDPGPPGEYFSPYGVIPEGNPNAKIKVGTITDGPEGEYIVDRQAAEAVKFIRESKDQPFFLNLWCYGVHGPWGHKKEYTEEFAKKTDPRGVQGNPIMASMLRSVDECFGKIMDELDQLGLTENTIVIFYSDNGGNTHSNVPSTAKTEKAEKFKSEFLADWRKWAGDRPPTDNTPLREGKSSLYEGGTRVPMIWSWGKRFAPTVNEDSLVGHIDIYPTILELTGVARPPEQNLDGVSLAPVLTGQGKLERTAFFNYFPYRPNEGGATVCQGDFKLIRWFGEGVPRELYNLKEDLGETNNLAAQMPGKVAELEALLEGYLADTGALIPKPNPAYTPRVNAKIAADPMRGLVPKASKATLKKGYVLIEGQGKKPFLGHASVQSKVSGPSVLHLRARSAVGGQGRLHWRTAGQATYEEGIQSVDYELPAGEAWQDIKVNIPVNGKLVAFRLYLPAEKEPVEIESLALESQASGQATASWNFAVQP